MSPASPASVGVVVERARRLELADVVRGHAPDYRRTHRLSRAQHRALDAIANCRTAALGGHRAVCTACGAERITYNSCRNRHCPKCQRVATERWLAARRREVLPIPYFHVVFTLPHALNPLAQSHPRLIYRLLFESAASTLRRFGRDPRQLGGDVGVTAVLHTWGQTLAQHVHVHCVVTGGALATDGTRWIPARPGFLFPVRALAKVFRGHYLARLQHAFDHGELHLTGGLAPLAEPAAFAAWLAALRRSPWVVYCKPPFAGPDYVLAYLARYTHRVAISNDRLITLADRRVRFRWRDYTDDDRVKVMELDVAEFLRRFLLHIVPDGFVRIRCLRSGAAVAMRRAMVLDMDLRTLAVQLRLGHIAARVVQLSEVRQAGAEHRGNVHRPSCASLSMIPTAANRHDLPATLRSSVLGSLTTRLRDSRGGAQEDAGA